MLRMVYVPESEDISAGEKLAIEHQIPIVHGKSDLMKKINFDDTIVQVLYIPEYKGGSQSAESIRSYFIISIKYEDEFIDMSNVECFLKFHYSGSDTEIILNPSIKEKHLLIFNIRPENPGVVVYDIIVDEEVVYSQMFGVL